MMPYRAFCLFCLIAAAASGCAGPPLSLYTLAAPDFGGVAPLGAAPRVVEIARVTLPDALDSQDILVREGATLRRSSQGRWASRLSLGMTDLLTRRLAARLPGALVTDQPQAGPVTARLIINISRLDVPSSGLATLDADWTIVPADPAMPLQRSRAHIALQGPVATDQDVVSLTGDLVEKLADAIDIGGVQ